MGQRCHFAHGKEDIRQINDVIPFIKRDIYRFFQPLPTTVVINEAKKPANAMNTSQYPLTDNYKTVKCRFFELGMSFLKKMMKKYEKY